MIDNIESNQSGAPSPTMARQSIPARPSFEPPVLLPPVAYPDDHGLEPNREPKMAGKPVGKKRSKETDAAATGNTSPLVRIEPDIIKVEKLVSGLNDLDDTGLIQELKSASRRIDDFDFAMRESTLRIQLWTWLAGTMLNAKKKKLGHGKFGSWRKKHLESVMCERTSQRYMKLAADNRNVRAMLEQRSDVPDTTVPGDDPVAGPGLPERQGKTKAGALMSSITGLQKNLRLFNDSGEQLGEAEVRELKLAKNTLDKFFAKVLSSVKADTSEGGHDA